ncbi:hypothetical protein ABEH28_13105 [Pseudomonas sp. Ps21-P2]|uniref:hypothetical protein n=1 Tax=Pseudomonas sp. Ps21-P2 TaxID=3080331 RepID=UPI0032088647
MNLPENVFENPYKKGQYLQFTMNVNEVIPNLVSTLEAYQAFTISENLEYAQSLLIEKGIQIEDKALAEFFSIHDLLACLFGQYGDLDVEDVWNSYVKDFDEHVAHADVKSAGFIIFKAYCYRAHKLEAVQEQWSDAEVI